MELVDLQAEFGRRWRIDLDPAAAGRRKDPWLFTVPCRHGHLFPAGGDLIGAATNRPGAIVRRLRAISGVEVVADGSDGANVVFPAAVVRYVARVMKPHSCRQLSPAHAAALARGRLSRKPPSGGAFQSAGSPIVGRPATDTPGTDRPSTGPDFTSRAEELTDG
jgi:hypothetical protein